MRYLLDVSACIALLVKNHTDDEAAKTWANGKDLARVTTQPRAASFAPRQRR